MIGSFEIEIRNTFTPSVESMGMVFVQTLGRKILPQRAQRNAEYLFA
jgi:hypothetical protein